MESQQPMPFISDESHDRVFVFKISEDPNLLEKLKNVEIKQVFSSLMDFCIGEIKVSTVFFS